MSGNPQPTIWELRIGDRTSIYSTLSSAKRAASARLCRVLAWGSDGKANYGWTSNAEQAQGRPWVATVTEIPRPADVKRSSR